MRDRGGEKSQTQEVGHTGPSECSPAPELLEEALSASHKPQGHRQGRTREARPGMVQRYSLTIRVSGKDAKPQVLLGRVLLLFLDQH